VRTEAWALGGLLVLQSKCRRPRFRVSHRNPASPLPNRRSEEGSGFWINAPFVPLERPEEGERLERTRALVFDVEAAGGGSSNDIPLFNVSWLLWVVGTMTPVKETGLPVVETTDVVPVAGRAGADAPVKVPIFTKPPNVFGTTVIVVVGLPAAGRAGAAAPVSVPILTTPPSTLGTTVVGVAPLLSVNPKKGVPVFEKKVAPVP
jgi:hypothetical protein